MRRKILDQNGLNFLTFTIVEWIDLFTRPVYKDIVIDSLKFCQEKKGLELYAYVIMPSHIHLIAKTENTRGLSPIIQSFKSFTAKRFLDYIKDHQQPESRREWLLNHFAFNARKNKTHSIYQIWQANNHPTSLISPKVTRQKLSYIHQNPVAAKMVALAEQYLYSSASNYVDGTGLLNVLILDNIWNEVGYIHTG